MTLVYYLQTPDQRVELADSAFRVGDQQLSFPENHSWKYLGLQYTTDLNWGPHLDRIETSFIIPTCNNISHSGYTLQQIQSIYREKVISRIQYTSQLLYIPQTYLRRWDKYLYGAIRKTLPRVYRSVAQSGLYHLLRIVPLQDYAPIVSLSELLIRLNTDSVSSLVERSRVQPYIQIDGTLLPSGRDKTTFAMTLNHWIRKGIRISLNLQSYHFQRTVTPMLTDSTSPWQGVTVDPRCTIYVYTDASTKVQSNLTGISCVTSVENNGNERFHATSCLVDTSIPFLGESLGIIRAIETAPDQPIRVHTDCERFVRGLARFKTLSQRQKLRTDFRCIFSHIVNIDKSRKQNTELIHIPRKQNTVADFHAKTAFVQSNSSSPNFLVGEERYVLFDKDHLVAGDYRKHLVALARRSLFDTWSEKSHQGRVARYVTSPAFSFPNPPSIFDVNLLTSTLPSARLLQHVHQIPNLCPFCHQVTKDNVHHFFSCPATSHITTCIPIPPEPPTYGPHNSNLDHLQHLLDFTNPIPPHIMTLLVNLYLMYCHIHQTTISPFTFRITIETLPTTPPQPPHIQSLSHELQRIFSCGTQICQSHLDLTPQTFSWFFWNHPQHHTLKSFDLLHSFTFSGSIICSFPVNSTDHIQLLAFFHMLSQRQAPFRVVFFAHETSELSHLDQFRLPDTIPGFHVYLLENTSSSRIFHVNLMRFFDLFEKHYASERQLLPSLRSTTDHLRALDHLSSFFWIPELGLRTITPPTLSMVQHDPTFFTQIPLELRILGLRSPTITQSHMQSESFLSVSNKLREIFHQLYLRRAQLWQKYLHIIKPSSTH